MFFDGHIHVMGDRKEKADFDSKMKEAGVDGGVVLSLPPAVFRALGKPLSVKDRLEDLFYWTEGNENLYPFYWIDPTEDDAIDQVGLAVEKGVMGFKVICSQHRPGDERAMPVYSVIAKARKPILFHSGILWDGLPSSPNNRPVEWEAMLDVEGLRFSLAHVSWPWYDECIAVYGKFQTSLSRRSELSCEMFIDLTPGTPEIYRREVLTKLYTVGYDIENNIFWGSDNHTAGYSMDWVKNWLEIDKGIFNELGLSEDVQEKALSGNLKRFVGIE